MVEKNGIRIVNLNLIMLSILILSLTVSNVFGIDANIIN